MNTTILIVLFSIVAVPALALLEHSLESGSSGVPNRKLSAHLSKAFPAGFYSPGESPLDDFAKWGFALSLFTFELLAINIPKFQNLGLIYAILGLTTLAVAIGEAVGPKKLKVAALTTFSGYNVSLPTIIGAGILLSIIFVPISMFLAVGLQVKTFSIAGSPALSALTICLLIPAIEEGVFAAAVGTSFVERFGVVGGILGITIFWIGFHIAAYAPLTIASIAYLGFFRVGAMIPVVKFKSSLPAFLAHMAVNTGALLASWGVIMG